MYVYRKRHDNAPEFKRYLITGQARSRGRSRGGLEPPQKFWDELNSATKVEFFY